MDDIFSKNEPFIIENVFLNDREADIFIDSEGRIGSIGPGTAKKYSGEAAFFIDGNGALALPGLVNTHTHAAMTLLRGYADDMPLQEWLSDKIWPLEANLNGNDVYLGTKLACLEMIRSGTTAFNDMYFFMEDAARAVDEMGIRATLSYGFIDLFNDEKREHEIKATENMVKTIRAMNNSRIQPALGPHAIYTVSPEGLKWIAGYSSEEELPIHVHLSETEKEVNDAVSQSNKRPAEILDDCGILGDRTIAAHCCWLSREECALLGKRGVHVSHNPVSNMKLAVNRAMPYHWLREEGVNVCLGTDGCASNNNLDLFEEMKVAALLQKFSWNSQTLLPAGEALHMATEAGARALGLGTGTLSAGSPADLILVSRHTACNTPFHNPVSNLVYSCNGGSVGTVVCNGSVLMHERVIPGEEKILAEASGAAFDLVKRTKR